MLKEQCSCYRKSQYSITTVFLIATHANKDTHYYRKDIKTDNNRRVYLVVHRVSFLTHASLRKDNDLPFLKEV